jgi:8-oxo-dGTP diphosphatase
MSTPGQPRSVRGLRIDHSDADVDTSRLEWRPGVYALIFDERGQLLVLDNQWNGKHDLPGGGLEVWELAAAGLAREVWEETGLEVEIGEMILADDEFFVTPHDHHWHTIKLYYLARILGGELRPTIIEGEPSINPHWIDPAGLGKGDLTLGWAALQRALSLRNGDSG